MISGHRPRVGLSEKFILSFCLVAIALILVATDWLWRWDRLVYDLNIWFWSHSPPGNDIVIVAIDEHSLSVLGRWPWSRRWHARLIDRLAEAGAKSIGLDIILAEADSTEPQSDAALASALKHSSRVVLPVLPERLGGQLVETLPIPILAAAAAGLGQIDIEPDQDGIVRGCYLKAGLGSPRWPTLALAMLDLANADSERHLPGTRANPSSHWSPYAWVRDYRIEIPYTGPPGSFPQYSYIDVVNGDLPQHIFRDKFVLVGATAAGLAESFATPTAVLSGATMTGVEINANILNTLRNGSSIKPTSVPVSAAFTAILVLLPSLLYPRLSPRGALLAAAALFLLTLLCSFLLVGIGQLWFAPAPALLSLSLSYPLWSWRHLEYSLRSLFEEKERIRVTLHSIGSAVITTNADGTVDYLNPMAERLTGYSAEDARGRRLDHVLRLNDENHDDCTPEVLSGCLNDDRLVMLSESSDLVSHAGQRYAVRGSAAPIHNQHGRVSGMVLAINDVSEAARMAQQIAYQATYDALTRLPNRNLLRDRLTHAIARAQRSNHWVAVLFIDLDNFKKINDSLGHAAGDHLLQAVATRLRTCIRQDDTVARLGGDEFIVLLEDLPQQEIATTVAQKIVNTLVPSFPFQQQELFITASIGISLFPKDGIDEQTLLKNADIALYGAKERGRNTFQYHTLEMNARATERLGLENDLRYALERNQLLLHYQPQVQLESFQIIGVEALLRWHHPQRGMVSPGQMIPLAEETGLILPIGAWVLRTACTQAKIWQEQGLRPLRIAVNLSARQFLQADLTELVSETLRETGLSPHFLELEITESLLMKDVDSAIFTLQALKSMGVQLAIDDFGTGYSSLNYLKRFPLDRLKIDQSFVRDVTTDPDDAAIALAVIAMAHSMRLGVIAEGVETREQLLFLRNKRCNEIQGFYISKPLSAENTAAMLQQSLALNLKEG